MKWNFIGDIHGRTCWKDLVREDCTNVFLGDYFSPYEFIPFEEQMNNFMDIIVYKGNHPDTIILVGNHDEDHWHWLKGLSNCSRHNFHFEKDICQAFEENKDYLQLAYAPDDKVIATHAGVTKMWFENCFHVIPAILPTKLAKMLNDYWKHCPDAFSFSNCFTKPYECYGDEVSHSPLWVRVPSLLKDSFYKGQDIVQVVGHSQCKKIITPQDCDQTASKVYVIDVLGTEPASLMYDGEKFEIYKPNKL